MNNLVLLARLTSNPSNPINMRCLTCSGTIIASSFASRRSLSDSSRSLSDPFRSLSDPSRSLSDPFRSLSSRSGWHVPRAVGVVFHVQWRSMAGHSKWQNIRHVKAATDAKKGSIASKYAMLIKKEATRGGADIKLNGSLSKLVEIALKAGVTKETINRNIEKAKNISINTFTVEILGPGSSIILTNIDAENSAKARQEIKQILKDINLKLKTKGTALMKEGSGIQSFEPKGAVKISRKDKNGGIVTLEKAEEIGIEAEAEEVVGEEDGADASQPDGAGVQEDANQEEDSSWTLRCPSSDLYLVKSYVEKNFPDIVITDCETEYIPRYQIDLSDEDMEKAAIVCSELESNEEISKVTSNIKWT